MVQNIVGFFTSPRFKSFLGHCLAVGGVALLNDVSANLTSLSLPVWLAAVVGLFVAQLVGALNAFVNGQPAGFSGK